MRHEECKHGKGLDPKSHLGIRKDLIRGLPDS